MIDVGMSVYLRDDRVIVCPATYGIDIEPALVVPAVDAEVQRAIEEAMRISHEAAAKGPPEYDPKKWPLLKALGLKSARAFHVNVAHVIVLIHEGNIEVRPSAPTKRGQAFEGVGASIPVPDLASLGTAALAALKAAPRMNPPPA
jgi:hypothetical protein